jgi:hypothetical protein
MPGLTNRLPHYPTGDSLFYRMTRLHFDDDRFGELIDWAESAKPRVQEITGLVFADIARTGPKG